MSQEQQQLGRVYALMGELPSAAALHRAAEGVRDKGFSRWDVYSPFPIHGMDAAMGLGKSPISYVVFGGGTLGALTGFILQVYTSVYDYPTIVQGKPVNYMSMPAFFPVIFELTILLSAFTVIACLLIFNQLPRWNHPMFNWDEFKRATDDGFFLAIEAKDPQFSEETTRKLLEDLGASNITLVREEI